MLSIGVKPIIIDVHLHGKNSTIHNNQKLKEKKGVSMAEWIN